VIIGAENTINIKISLASKSLKIKAGLSLP